jgi:hypothetical protein
MELRKLISRFITQICEKNYSKADKALETIVSEKLKTRIKDIDSKVKNKKDCGCGCGGKCKEKNSKKTKKVSKKVTKKG